MADSSGADSSGAADERTGKSFAHLKVTKETLKTLNYDKGVKGFFEDMAKLPRVLVWMHTLGNFRDHAHVALYLR